MKRELKTKALAALRSGEYKQNHRTIGSGKYLCCIGVIGTVAGLQPPLNESGSAQWTTGNTADTVGLTRDQRTRLIEMNDNARDSFPVIADWIEANIPAED